MKSIQINNQTIQIPDDRYNELVKEFCGSKRCKPVEGDIVWTIKTNGKEVWESDFIERLYGVERKLGLIFRTKEEAEAKLAYINALAEINEYIAENEGKYTEDKDCYFSFVYNVTTNKVFHSQWYRDDKLLTGLSVNSMELALDLIANQSHNLKVVAGIK